MSALRKLFKVILGMVLTVFFMVAFAGVATAQELYLKNNVHAQQSSRHTKASYANWTDPGRGHIVIPVNSAITIGNWRGGFHFIIKETGAKVYYEVNTRNLQMSVHEYLQLITSPSKTSLDHLSELDRKGIRQGKIFPGMTKEGVRIAMGYPAPHRTISLDVNEWIYWKNRWLTQKVSFTAEGKVSGIR